MKLICALFVFLLVTGSNFAQDSLDYFPLKTGNYWEYWTEAPWDIYGYYYTVSGDTIFENGKKYYHLERHPITSGTSLEWDGYFRKDSSKIFQYYPLSECSPSNEYIYFDFNSPDKNLWPVCRKFYYEPNYRGVDTTFGEYNYVFSKNVITKVYAFARIDNNDTIWSPIGTDWPLFISSGIGITKELIELTGEFFLKGAIVDGKKYGVITSIESEKAKYNLINNDFSIFPNPTNGFAKIAFILTERSDIKISLYNSIGEKIYEIIKEYSAGYHEYLLNTSKLSSGMYILNLYMGTSRGSNLSNKKLILLK